jgi:glycosyltransferase involved in cell wall biosynthesis
MQLPMIVLLHGARAFGAVENYALEVVRGLAARDEQAVLLHADDPVLAPFASGAVGTVRVEALPSAAIFGNGIHALFQLRRAFRRLRPDVVHLIDVWPVAAVAARLAGVPRIIVTHHTPELPRRDSLVGRLWWRFGWAVRPEVVYTSAWDRDTDGRVGLRRHVVSLGIDLDRFRTAEPALPSDGPVIGTVGRLDTQKAHRVLLEAAPLVLERHPNARFVFVGDGPLRARLEDQAAALGVQDTVIFTGARDDVPRWLASFDVFVLPSLFEGLCYAVIEAQAAGVPVVATPVGGVRETVIDDETGILVPPTDSQATARAILRLLERPEDGRRLAAEASARVGRFSVERMVEETIALYGSAGAG